MWFLGVFENRVYQQVLAVSLDLGYPNHINFCFWFCDFLFFLFRWIFLDDIAIIGSVYFSYGNLPIYGWWVTIYVSNMAIFQFAT